MTSYFDSVMSPLYLTAYASVGFFFLLLVEAALPLRWLRSAKSLRFGGTMLSEPQSRMEIRICRWQRNTSATWVVKNGLHTAEKGERKPGDVRRILRSR